jgi:probable HAF family extracellular repeat protein
MRTAGTWALVAICTMVFGVTAPALTSFSVVDLGTLGGTNSLANAINNRLQVVGASADASGVGHAFLWENGTMQDLGLLPGGTSAFASDINDRGQIVGYGNTAVDQFQVHAILWDGGAVIDLGTLPGGSVSVANAINARGQVVGTSQSADGQIHAVLWDRGALIDLGTLMEGGSSGAIGISDSGRVVGVTSTATDERHAFLWEKGTMIDLGTLPGDFLSQALGINNRGQVVGRSANVQESDRAFLWDNGVMREVHPPSAKFSLLVDINERGEAVGGITRTAEFTGRAAVFYRGTFALLPTPPGDEPSVATGINNRGYIVGYSGSRAVLWSPVSKER